MKSSTFELGLRFISLYVHIGIIVLKHNLMFAFNQKVYIIYMQYIDPNVVVQLTGDEI